MAPKNLEEAITFHKVPKYQKESIAVDCMIRIVPGDRACLYNCAALMLYGTIEEMKNHRREAHKFIIKTLTST